MLLNSARVKLVMIELLKCKTVHVKTIGIAHIFFDCMSVVTGCPTLMVKRSQAGLPRAEFVTYRIIVSDKTFLFFNFD